MDKAPQLFVGIFEQTPDPEEIEWAHRHTYYSIVWFTSGKGFNVIDFSAYELLPNRFFTMNPHQVHNWKYSQNAQGFFVLVAPALALELSLHFSTPYTDLPVDDLPFVHTLFSKMQQQTDSKKQTIALQYFISLLENNKGEIPPLSPLVQQYKALLTEELGKHLSMQAYAERLHTSLDVLNRECKTYTGLSPKQLQIDMQLTEAKRLLLYTSLTINEIAYHLGFEDSSYFSRIFREKTSLAPSAFREEYLS
jgi:transcriptional regulator